MAESELLIRLRLREIEKELASVKIECQRLTKLEDELKAIRNDFTIIGIEHENLKSDRKDIRNQVDSVDRYISECLDVVDTTAGKIQTIEDSVSDLQKRDISCIIGAASEAATAGAHDGPSVPAEFVAFGAAFFQKMDDMQAKVSRKTDENNSAVLKRLDTIEAIVQLKFDRIREEEGRQLTIEATDNILIHNQTLETRPKIEAEMMVGIAKKMEDVLEHSTAVISCETKLEKLEKMISQSMNANGVEGILNELDAKFDGLEQRMVALGDQNVQEFIDIDQKFNAIMRQGDIHGLGNHIKSMSKLGTTMEAFDKTFRSTSTSETSLQNILQWNQSINGKLVDLSGKIDTLSGRGKGADTIQRAVTGLATKANLQYMAASSQNGRPGKDPRRDRTKLISAPASGPSRPKELQAVRLPTLAVMDRPKPKLATTLGLLLNPQAKLPAAAAVSPPAVPIQANSAQVKIASEDMCKVHSAETVEQVAEHLAIAEGETAKAVPDASKTEEEPQRVKAEPNEADKSETGSDDNALLARFAEMKKSMQPSEPTVSEMGLQRKTSISNKEDVPSWLASLVTSSPITLTNATNMKADRSSALSTPKLSPDFRASTSASSLNAQAADFKMPRPFSLISQSPLEDEEDKVLPDTARMERAKSPSKFAESY